MELTDQIKNKIEDAFHPHHMDLINESHMHAGPATESHFKLILVSEHFKELNRVKRHQFVYKVLQEELSGPVHALAIHPFSPEEWEIEKKVPGSPLCSGKNT